MEQASHTSVSLYACIRDENLLSHFVSYILRLVTNGIHCISRLAFSL